MIYSADVIKALWDGNFCFQGRPETEEEFNKGFMPVIGTNEIGTNVYETDPDNFPVSWVEFQAKRAELEAAEPLRLLRVERDKLIAETDWWVLPDRTPTQAQLDYRQALRDITDTYTSLDDVVWPEKP